MGFVRVHADVQEYEVFARKTRLEPLRQVGAVVAPDDDLAEEAAALGDRGLAVAADLAVAVQERRSQARDEERDADGTDEDEDAAGAVPVHAAATAAGLRSRRRNLPVYDASTAATSSGVPTATISPPASPPSGPRSMR